MRRFIGCLIPTVAAGLLLSLIRPTLGSWAEVGVRSQSYQLSFVSKTTLDFGTDRYGIGRFKVQEHEGTVLHTLHCFEWPHRTTLFIDRLRQKYTGDGEFMYDTTMDREQIARVVNGKTETKAVADLPGDAKARILNTFGVPLCTTEYDLSGQETKRTVVTDTAAKMAVVMSEMNNTMFFHPPFVVGKDEWQYATEFDTIDPGIARGTMTYKKGETKDTLVYVHSSGVFTSETCPLPTGGMNAKDLKSTSLPANTSII